MSGDGASVDVIRRVLAEHARLAVDPNNVCRYRRSITCREWFVVGEEAHDDGIAEEGALHTTAFDREVDDTDDQHVARPSSQSPNAPLDLCTTPARSQAAKRRNFRSVMKQFGEVRQAVAERKPKRWRRNAARRSGIAIRLNSANGTYWAA